MVDIVNQTMRSRMMAGIRGKNTKPELIVRKYLHSCGFRYRLHVASLPGSPDLALPRYKLAIFVHGCFWHQHAGCRYATMPDQNFDRWQRKFSDNLKRDLFNITQLQEKGWRTMIIWECGLRTGEGRKRLNLLPDIIVNQRISAIEWPRYVN